MKIEYKTKHALGWMYTDIANDPGYKTKCKQDID